MMREYIFQGRLLSFLLLSCGLIFSSCFKSAPDSPEQAVKIFVNAQFDGAGIEKLQELSTGELLDSLSSLSEEEANKLLDISKFKFKSLKILQKTENPDDASVTYVITYKDTSVIDETSESSQAVVESKKICLLKRVEGIWKLADITEFKTVIESERPL